MSPVKSNQKAHINPPKTRFGSQKVKSVAVKVSFTVHYSLHGWLLFTTKVKSP